MGKTSYREARRLKEKLSDIDEQKGKRAGQAPPMPGKSYKHIGK